jgi:hypothetical protein
MASAPVTPLTEPTDQAHVLTLANGQRVDLRAPWTINERPLTGLVPQQSWARHLTDEQIRGRALQETAMRADKLRGLPTGFGDLS